jgi:hypothetical protein
MKPLSPSRSLIQAQNLRENLKRRKQYKKKLADKQNESVYKKEEIL